MPQESIIDLQEELVSTITMSDEKVNQIATVLLDAPADKQPPVEKRLSSILLHPNISREVYERVLNEHSSAPRFFDPRTNLLYLLIDHKHATLSDLHKLKDWAAEYQATEWFNRTILNTYGMTTYQLQLSYNGQQMVTGKERELLQKTSNLLQVFRDNEGS